MGDTDQGLTALLGRLAAQLRDAVLGDHIVDVVLAGRYMRAGLERRHDARDGVALGSRRPVSYTHLDVSTRQPHVPQLAAENLTICAQTSGSG